MTMIHKGRIADDIKLEYTPTGIATVKVRVVLITDSYKAQSGEWQDKTVWVDMKVWRDEAERLARAAEAGTIGKGASIAIEGVLSQRSYERQDGSKGSALEIEARNVYLSAFSLDRYLSGGAAPARAAAPAAAPASTAAAEADYFGSPDPSEEPF